MLKKTAVKMRRVLERVREDGLMETARYALTLVGIDIRPFYLMVETLPEEIPTALTAAPEGFEFSIFGREDVETIAEIPERHGYVGKQRVMHNFEAGDTCMGLKKDGRIAAFTWFSTGDRGSIFYSPRLKENEAYLYDVYVLEDFRRRNLATVLRHKSYEILVEMGRDTFYSITEASNKPSMRLKEKLGARRVFLGAYVKLFRKWVFRPVLRSYPGADAETMRPTHSRPSAS